MWLYHTVSTHSTQSCDYCTQGKWPTLLSLYYSWQHVYFTLQHFKELLSHLKRVHHYTSPEHSDYNNMKEVIQGSVILYHLSLPPGWPPPTPCTQILYMPPTHPTPGCRLSGISEMTSLWVSTPNPWNPAADSYPICQGVCSLWVCYVIGGICTTVAVCWPSDMS